MYEATHQTQTKRTTPHTGQNLSARSLPVRNGQQDLVCGLPPRLWMKSMRLLSLTGALRRRRSAAGALQQALCSRRSAQ